MSRKRELQEKIVSIQKEYSAAAKELKDIQREEQNAVQREKYKDYVFKVQYYVDVDAEDRIMDVTDEDRELARVGNTGFILTGPEERPEISYVMMKSKDEYPRVKRLFEVVKAVNLLVDKNTQNKEKYVKIILGEQDEVQG